MALRFWICLSTWTSGLSRIPSRSNVQVEVVYMARQYSLKTFIRRAPNELLRCYLDERGVGGVPWRQLKKSSVDPVYRAIEAADE